MNRTAAEVLAEFAFETRYRDLPGLVVEKLRAHVLDSLGSQALGAIQPWVKVVRDYAVDESPPGRATFVGVERGGRPEWAALANGTAAQGFEIDDYHAAQVHPSAIAVPTAFAVAEETPVDDETLLVAIALGFELGIRIALAAAPGIASGRGIHPVSAVGPFAAAIVAAKLRGLDTKQMTHALGIAGSHAGGTMEYTQTGGEVKRMHAGIANMAGIRSASLAGRGLTAPPTILEGRRGFYQAYSNRVDLHLLTGDLGINWLALGSAIKPYCANGRIQAQLQAIYEMVAEDGLVAGEVESIVVLAIAEKVRLELDPQVDADYPHVYSARVTVTRANGQQLSRHVNAPGSAQDPLSFTQVREKFGRAARVALDDARLARIEGLVAGMPDHTSASSIMPMLRSAGRQVEG